MSKHDLEKLIHAFICSRVDYCNGLFTGLPKKAKQLHLVKNRVLMKIIDHSITILTQAASKSQN